MYNSATSITIARDNIRRDLAQANPRSFDRNAYRAVADAMHAVFPQNTFAHLHGNPQPWFAMGLVHTPNTPYNDLLHWIQTCTTINLNTIQASLFIYDIDTTAPPLHAITDIIQTNTSTITFYAAIVTAQNHFIAYIKNNDNHIYKYDGMHLAGKLLLQTQSINQLIQSSAQSPH
jgi:hypothetical protein